MIRSQSPFFFFVMFFFIYRLGVSIGKVTIESMVARRLVARNKPTRFAAGQTGPVIYFQQLYVGGVERRVWGCCRTQIAVRRDPHAKNSFLFRLLFFFLLLPPVCARSCFFTPVLFPSIVLFRHTLHFRRKKLPRPVDGSAAYPTSCYSTQAASFVSKLKKKKASRKQGVG